MQRAQAARAHGDPLGEFRVGPGPPPLELRARLRAYLNAAISEAPLQRFLELVDGAPETQTRPRGR